MDIVYSIDDYAVYGVWLICAISYPNIDYSDHYDIDWVVVCMISCNEICFVGCVGRNGTLCGRN